MPHNGLFDRLLHLIQRPVRVYEPGITPILKMGKLRFISVKLLPKVAQLQVISDPKPKHSSEHSLPLTLCAQLF